MTALERAARSLALQKQYPRVSDAGEAINFAIEQSWEEPVAGLDFLSTWRDGAWDEIEQAYPEYLERCK